MEQQMNYDELAFFYQQLAGMLKSGIPLEGAVAHLSRNMRKSGLKQELELLGSDLREGIPLDRALERRKLPRVYTQMVRAGAQSQSLPTVLTLVADYYGRVHVLSTRVKGLMVYPAIVLAGSLAVSLLLSLVYMRAFSDFSDGIATGVTGWGPAMLVFWVPSLVFFAGLALLCIVLASPKLRNWLRWHFPGLKDASIAQSAATIATLLSAGSRLDTTLELVEQTEANSPGASDLARWRKNVEQGRASFPQMAEPSRAFPPLFIWLVAQCGEDITSGFRRASEIYGERARHRTEMLLFAALPLAVLVLGMMILGQTFSVAALMGRFFDALGM